MSCAQDMKKLRMISVVMDRWLHRCVTLAFPFSGNEPLRARCLSNAGYGRGLLTPLRPGIDRHRDDDDRPFDDVLVERLDAEHVEAVADQREEQNPDDGAPDRPLAAGDAGAADDDGGDRRQLDQAAGVGLSGRDARGGDQSGQSGGEAADAKVSALTQPTRMPESRAASALPPTA